MASPSASYDMEWLHWGVIVSTALFGVNVMQSWIYFNNNNDKWHLRLFIAVLMLLDLATTFLNSFILRHYSATNFGTSLAFVPTVITIDVQTILTAIVIFLVQLFLASRVYLLNHSWYTPTIIICCATGGLVSTLLYITNNIMHSLVIYLSSTQVKIKVALSISFALAADIVATISLCWKLSSSNAGVKRMQTVLHQLFLQFITRGILVTLFQFGHVLVFELQPVSLHWIPFTFLACKVYINTTLAILNNRISLRAKMDTDAIDLSKCMAPISFEMHHANQTLDMEAQTITPECKGVVNSHDDNLKKLESGTLCRDIVVKDMACGG